jgi:hypothetical protein
MSESASTVSPIELARMAHTLLHFDSTLTRSMVTHTVIWFFHGIPESPQGLNTEQEDRWRLDEAIELMKERLFTPDELTSYGRQIEDGVNRAQIALKEARRMLSPR